VKAVLEQSRVGGVQLLAARAEQHARVARRHTSRGSDPLIRRKASFGTVDTSPPEPGWSAAA
jgi:hypothetical protein